VLLRACIHGDDEPVLEEAYRTVSVEDGDIGSLVRATPGLRPPDGAFVGGYPALVVAIAKRALARRCDLRADGAGTSDGLDAASGGGAAGCASGSDVTGGEGSAGSGSADGGNAGGGSANVLKGAPACDAARTVVPQLTIADVDAAFCAHAEAALTAAGVRACVEHAPLESTLWRCDAVVHPGPPQARPPTRAGVAVLEAFGPRYIEALYARVDELGGTQPADHALVVPTGHPGQSWAIHVVAYPAPPAAAYTALAAALRAVAEHNASGHGAIRTLACPALGTFVGCTFADGVARQMAQALHDAQTDCVGAL